MDPQDQQYADKYLIRKKIGYGGQANVYLGCFEKKFYALKVYFLDNQIAFNREVHFLTQLHFIHLLNMVDHKIDAPIKIKNQALITSPLIVLELADGGQLFNFIIKTGRFPPPICRTYAKQLISAVKHMADCGVSHRDLKPANILFDKYFILKVSDLGLSCNAVGNNNNYILTSIVGTDGYCPPEMYAKKYTGLQADIFATGVIIFNIYTGGKPFQSANMHDPLYKLIRHENFTQFWQQHEKGRQPGFFSEEFKRLIQSFFSYEINKRPSFQSLEQDKWLNGPQLTPAELQQQMNIRHQKILKKDAKLKEIDTIRRQQFQQEVMEQQKSPSQQNPDRPISNFIRAYRDYNTNIVNIDNDQYQYHGLVYTNKKLGFVLAWLQDFLDQQYKQKQVFLTEFLQTLQPLNFVMKLNKDEKEIDVSLKFKVDNEDTTELIVTGKLHRCGQQVAIEWHKIQGNQFWLEAVIDKLNASLRSIE